MLGAQVQKTAAGKQSTASQKAASGKKTAAAGGKKTAAAHKAAGQKAAAVKQKSAGKQKASLVFAKEFCSRSHLQKGGTCTKINFEGFFSQVPIDLISARMPPPREDACGDACAPS